MNKMDDSDKEELLKEVDKIFGVSKHKTTDGALYESRDRLIE